MQHIEDRTGPKVGVLLATGLSRGRRGSASSWYASQAVQVSLKGPNHLRGLSLALECKFEPRNAGTCIRVGFTKGDRK